MPQVLSIEDLKVFFKTEFGIVRAVDGVSFGVDTGKTVGVVGESGCGKSVTALAVMGLIRPPGWIDAGQVRYRKGREDIVLTDLSPNGAGIRSIRGNDIAMIFQEPMTSLNPVFTIGFQIMESIRLHQGLGKSAARDRAVEMLEKVGIPLPERRVDEYPHQLSGGMRQRAMIAMALSCHPAVLIADEPTTALDVTIQAQVLELMMELKKELGTAVILITHDLGVVAETADDVVVMYLGKVVEQADVKRVFKHRKHPYTVGLLSSVPSIIGEVSQLKPIEGVVPDPYEVPAGCPFEPRCNKAMDVCSTRPPELTEVESGHRVACWLYDEE
ncbi:MAG: ABC transporter ATP-binding protein [Deltaproteobacteria bacterium]|nr:ABC transporter ATP-binding protein [Deltaproteobacteria bacterium]